LTAKGAKDRKGREDGQIHHQGHEGAQKVRLP